MDTRKICTELAKDPAGKEEKIALFNTIIDAVESGGPEKVKILLKSMMDEFDKAAEALKIAILKGEVEVNDEY